MPLFKTKCSTKVRHSSLSFSYVANEDGCVITLPSPPYKKSSYNLILVRTIGKENKESRDSVSATARKLNGQCLQYYSKRNARLGTLQECKVELEKQLLDLN